MKEIIEKIVKDLYINVNRESDQKPSLLAGGGGKSLFNILYISYFHNGEVGESLQNELQVIGENSFSYGNSTMCNGKSGINWLFVYLYKRGLLDQEIKEIICSDDFSLAIEAEAAIDCGNYDYLHGALGISYYLLYHTNHIDLTFFEKIFNELITINNQFGGTIPNWDIENRKFQPGYINLGLAHGLPSILKYCIQSYLQGICTKQAADLAEKIVNVLMKVKKEDNSFSYYPPIYKEGATIHSDSRLAWCYGDLSLAFILYQYGKSFNNQEVERFALDILRQTTYRKSKDSTKVNDVGICHGSAGIAHIYNKLWHYTNEEIFEDARGFWIKNIISEWERGDGTIYKKYNGLTGCYENCTNLLEGSAGVGLVLLSYLSGDFSWDYCLMLNT